MIEREEAKRILLIALSRGGDFAEIYIERTTSTTLRLDDNKIEEVVIGTDEGVGMRLVDGERTFFINGNRLETESLKEMARELADGVGGERRIAKFGFQGRELPSYSPIEVPPDAVSADEKVELLWRANSAAREYDQRIAQVTATYRDISQEVLIANSEGVFDRDHRIHSLLHVVAVAKEGDLMQTGIEMVAETRGFELFRGQTPEEVAREAARVAVLQLGARPAPAGTFTVVISSEAGGTMIHEACGHGLEGDFVKRGLSIYAGKLGQKVASELVTVIDDGTLPNKRGTARMDDEGYPTQQVVLIEKGILKGYLQSRKSAQETALPRTGSGRRESYRSLPIPRMRNTFVAPGETLPEEIIASVGEGVLVKRMGGGQVDIVNGNFVFQVLEGYLIRDGKVREAIRGATLTGNGPKVLEEVDMVGRDLGFDVGTCGKDGQPAPVSDAMPTLRIPALVVGGLVER